MGLMLGIPSVYGDRQVLWLLWFVRCCGCVGIAATRCWRPGRNFGRDLGVIKSPTGIYEVMHTVFLLNGLNKLNPNYSGP